MKSTLSRGRPEVSASNSFRHRLQAELARRCARNPRYSLRAFARQLDIDHSTLSQLIRSKRRLTPATIRRLGRELGLAEEETEGYVASQRLLEATADAGRRRGRELTGSLLEVLGDGLSLSLLELTRLDDFRPDVRWVARALGTSTDRIQLALQALMRLELLRMEAPDRWVDRSGDAVVCLEDLGRVALERYADGLRRISAEALRRLPPELRDHSAVTLAVAVDRLPEVRERIARFRRELTELLQDAERRDDVYRLEIAFHPVTRILDEPSRVSTDDSPDASTKE